MQVLVERPRARGDFRVQSRVSPPPEPREPKYLGTVLNQQCSDLDGG